MKTCKTCGGPLLYWNPETFTYRQVVKLLWELHKAGETQLPEGIYTLEAAINCQKCASVRKRTKHRTYIGPIEQSVITRHLSAPLTCSQLGERIGVTRRSSYRRLLSLEQQGVVKCIGGSPKQYVAA